MGSRICWLLMSAGIWFTVITSARPQGIRLADAFFEKPKSFISSANLSKATMSLAQSKKSGGDKTLSDKFTNPTAETRILKIIHGWPDDAKAQQNLIQQLQSQGFGGVVCNVSFTDYLKSEDRWKDFLRAINAARAAGMTMWLYDDKGYPSGAAGGLTLMDHPEYEAQGLLISDNVSSGGRVNITVPPGKLYLASAFPVIKGHIDLKHGLNLQTDIHDGKLEADLPAGNWHVMAITEDVLFEGTHVSISFGAHIPYINLLEAAPTKRFIELTHQQYYDRTDGKLSNYFQSTFTDEPSLMSYFFRPMPYRVIPWGPSLPLEFLKRRGYALKSELPALIADAGEVSSKVRYDFWQTVGDMVSENFFGQIQTWGRSHGVQSGGHLLMEEGLIQHVALYGNFFQCIRRLDAPSIDCLTSIPAEVPWHIARLLSSAAEIEGRPLRMCETSDFGQVYRGKDDTRPVKQVTEDEIRGTCNRLILNGITTITSYYTFNGLSNDQLNRINKWVGRCNTMLNGGYQVADIALVFPTESIWPRFIPSRSGVSSSSKAGVIDSVFHQACESLYASQRDFTIVDSKLLAEAKVENGTLVSGKLRWRVVVLPTVDTLPLKAWENLAGFVRSGGTVIALSTKPANSEKQFPSPRVRAIAKEILGDSDGAHVMSNARGGSGIYLPSGSESLLPVTLNGLIEKDVWIPHINSPIRITHRKINNHDVYFLINDSDQPWKGMVNFSAAGPGEYLDPTDGNITPLSSGKNVAIDIPGYGAVLTRFASVTPPKKHILKSGSIPGLKFQPVNLTKPFVGAGEFVTSTLTEEGKGWKSVGVLKKSDVDTFLFLSFKFVQPLELNGTDGLSMDIQTPDGQSTGSNLLVIAIDKEGREYMADTGRSLSLSGKNRLVIPWSRFQLAGWSKVTGGSLNTSAISAVNFGWGGYLGAEGEKVEFKLYSIESIKLP